MGGSEIDFSQIPLMSPAQEKALEDLLPKVMMGMQGFPLGEAYGGPSQSSYGVTRFGYPREFESDPGESEIPTGGGDFGQFDPNQPNPFTSIGGKGGQPVSTKPNGGTTTIAGGGERKVTSPKKQPDILDKILNVVIPGDPNLKLPESPGVFGGFQPTPSVKQSPVDEILTQPIISPFTQGLTGNFPKRRGG